MCFNRDFSSSVLIAADHSELSVSVCVYSSSEKKVQSLEKDKDGQPLLLLSGSAIRVRSFAQLSRLLYVAAEKRLKETQACLQGNILHCCCFSWCSG